MTRRRHQQRPAKPTASPSDPLTRRLEEVLRRALSPDPKERHVDGAALARDLTLCLNPGAWELLKETSHGWQLFFRRWPLIALVPLNILPFVVAAVFNWYFNFKTIIEPLAKTNPQLDDAFYTLSFWINGILFPLGTALIIWYIFPVGVAVRAVDIGKPCSDAICEEGRRRVFWVGHTIALIGLSCWVIAGAVFPVALILMNAGLPEQKIANFLLSQTTCGLVSAGFPFLASTWISIRVFYPTLLGDGAPTETERRRLLLLPSHANISAGTAGLVPIFAAIMVIAAGGQQGLNEGKAASLVFLVASAGAFLVAAFGVVPRIRRDVAALAAATRPADTYGTVTDSVDF